MMASFKQSGLPDDADIRKAYDLVKDDEQALGAARIYADIYSKTDTIAAYLLSYAPAEAADEVAGTCADPDYVQSFAADLRAFRAQNLTPLDVYKRKSSDEKITATIIDVIYETERFMAEHGRKPLSSLVLETKQDGDGAPVIFQTDFESLLRKKRRALEESTLPCARELTAFYPRQLEKLETRFRAALRAVELKIALPEKPARPAIKPPVP